MNHEIYADHAATAPIEPLALEAMYTAYQEYANPAALYRSDCVGVPQLGRL